MRHVNLDDMVVSLVQQGYSYDLIAKRHDLKWWHVKDIAKRYDSGAYAQRSVLYSRSDLCQQIFEGVYVWNVADWIKRRWIHAAKASNRRSMYRITHSNLLKFLANEQGWIAWEPNQLKDKHLRAWAEELRASCQWRWLRAKEAARIAGIKRQNITKRIRHGWYKTAVLYTDIWFIRSDEFEQVEREYRARLTERKARDEAMTLGNALRNMRKERKLTLPAVVSQTGLSESFIRDVEHNRGNPSLDSLQKLLACYNAYAVIEAGGATVVARPSNSMEIN